MTRMKILLAVLAISILTLTIIAQEPVSQIPDKAKVEIQRVLLTQTRAINEFNALQQQIDYAQKRQAELRQTFQASQKELEILTKDVCGKGFRFNAETVGCEKPVASPSPTPKP